jgi:hypothetical protein
MREQSRPLGYDAPGQNTTLGGDLFYGNFKKRSLYLAEYYRSDDEHDQKHAVRGPYAAIFNTSRVFSHLGR